MHELALALVLVEQKHGGHAGGIEAAHVQRFVDQGRQAGVLAVMGGEARGSVGDGFTQQLAFGVGFQVDVVGLGHGHETGLQRRHLGLAQVAPQPGAQHGYAHDGAEEQGHFPAGGFLLAHARSCSQLRSCSIWRATERGPVPAGVSRRRTAAA